MECPGLGIFKYPDQIADDGICSQFSDFCLFPTLGTPPTRIWVSKKENKWKIMILPLMHGGHDMDN